MRRSRMRSMQRSRSLEEFQSHLRKKTKKTRVINLSHKSNRMRVRKKSLKQRPMMRSQILRSQKRISMRICSRTLTGLKWARILSQFSKWKNSLKKCNKSLRWKKALKASKNNNSDQYDIFLHILCYFWRGLCEFL